MAYPPATIQTNVTDATDQAGLHPALHNQMAQAINDIVPEVNNLKNGHVYLQNQITALAGADTALDARIDTLEAGHENVENRLDNVEADTARMGMIRTRDNIDAVVSGGSIRYTVELANYGITDVGDGSGFRCVEGIYSVSASTIPDAGEDVTCFIQIGGRTVAVGVGLPGYAGGETFAQWTGYVHPNNVIAVRVVTPALRAIVGGRLEIWRSQSLT